VSTEQDARVSTAGIINLALFRGQGSFICTMYTHTSWIYTFEPKNSVVDLDSLNLDPDPAFDVNIDPDPGF
jgi:hypothetical protein